MGKMIYLDNAATTKDGSCRLRKQCFLILLKCMEIPPVYMTLPERAKML